MTLADDSFYVSGTFWVGVLAFFAVLVAAWIGWVAVNPKRRLSYGMPVATPLLNAQSHGLQVLRGDTVLTDPRVLDD